LVDSDDEEDPMDLWRAERARVNAEDSDSDVDESPQDAIPGSLEEWLRTPANAEAMLKRIEEMKAHAEVHGLGPEQEGFKVKSRAITAKDLEAETQLIVCKKTDAFDAEGNLKKNIVSIQDVAEANPEMQGIPESAEERAGSTVNFCGEDEDVDLANIDIEEYIIVEIVLDSGAGEHVADRIDAPGYMVTESDGSKRGQNFLAA
jgi:hypothetical protein